MSILTCVLTGKPSTSTKTGILISQCPIALEANAHEFLDTSGGFQQGPGQELGCTQWERRRVRPFMSHSSNPESWTHVSFYSTLLPLHQCESHHIISGTLQGGWVYLVLLYSEEIETQGLSRTWWVLPLCWRLAFRLLCFSSDHLSLLLRPSCVFVAWTYGTLGKQQNILEPDLWSMTKHHIYLCSGWLWLHKVWTAHSPMPPGTQ